MKRYIILTANSTKELEDLVNRHIVEGWRPQGGVCESGDDEVMYLSQAMIRNI